MFKSRNLIYFLPSLLWMGVIFAFSHRPAIQASTVSWQDFVIKKTAHFVEYFVLTLTLFYSFKKSGSKSASTCILAAVFIAVCFAFSDEWHQTFIPGREGRLRDVFIDTTGAIAAALSLPRLNRKLI